jgi:rubrerythrin
MTRKTDERVHAPFALLRRAHGGELAAYLAYEGHWRSLRDPSEAMEVRAIACEELAHRGDLRRILDRFENRLAPLQEALFWVIGRGIGVVCRFGGWFAPMYGAGFLERGNIGEYERAATLAADAGLVELVEPLRRMAVVESEHEKYFRSKVQSHWLSRIVPIWAPPSATVAEFPVPELTEPVSPGPARSGRRDLPAETASARSRPAPVLPIAPRPLAPHGRSSGRLAAPASTE